MRAAIIVRKRQTDTIACLSYVEVDEQTVRDAIERLEQRFPEQDFRIDTSQVSLARQALAAA